MTGVFEFGEALTPVRALRRACADVFGIEEHRLVSSGRFGDVVRARHATCWVLKTRFPRISYPHLGRIMGGFDHSSMINAVRQHEMRMERDPALRELSEGLLRWPIPGSQPDSHVLLWRAYREHMDRCFPAQEVEESADEGPLSELAEFVDPEKVFCGQCDRAVPMANVARCQSRFCGLRVRTASSSGAVGRQRTAA